MKAALWPAMTVIVLAGCSGTQVSAAALTHVEDMHADTAVAWVLSSDCAGIGRVFAAEIEGLTLQEATIAPPNVTCRWTSENEQDPSQLQTFTVAMEPLAHDDVLLAKDMIMGMMGGTEIHDPQVEKLNGYALSVRMGDFSESINIVLPYTLLTASSTRTSGLARLDHASTVGRLASLVRRP